MAFITLYAMLDRTFSTSIYYDAVSDAYERHCSILGFIWNTESNFAEKKCLVELHEIDPKDYSKKYGLATCGRVSFSPDLNPEIEFYDKREVSYPPINILICLSGSAYETAEKLLSHKLENQQMVSLCFKFSLPAADNIYTSLERLDVSKKSSYFITDFSLKGDWLGRTDISVPKYQHDKRNWASIFFTASASTIKTFSRDSHFYFNAIEIDGRLQCEKFGIDSVGETMIIKEYPKQDYPNDNNFPEESFAGLVGIFKNENQPSCRPELYVTQATLENLANSLSNMTGNDTIRFSISVRIDRLFLSNDDYEELDIVGYSVEFKKRYT